MPLDTCYVKERKIYLEQSLKNQQKVYDGFLPRMIKLYNDNVPFTEGSYSEQTLDKPYNEPIVKGFLQSEDLNASKENLLLKLFKVINDNDISAYIISKLDNEEIIYYNEHFDRTQSELLKNIKLPISKEGFVSNLKQLFANDPFYKNILTIKSMASPPAPPTITTPIITPRTMPIIAATPYSRSKTLKKPEAGDSLEVINDWYLKRRQQIKETSYIGNNRQIQINNAIAKYYKYLEFNNYPINPPPSFDEPESKAEAKKAAPIGAMEQKGIGLRTQYRYVKHKLEFGNKHAIDLKKLSKNILALKYSKTGNSVPSFQPIVISNELKTIVRNIQESNRYEKEEVKDLSILEKRILRRLVHHLKLPSMSNTDLDDNFVTDFQICLGSFEAGNDSQILKDKLKEYVKVAIHEGVITGLMGRNILLKL